jgi:hypothetical protein
MNAASIYTIIFLLLLVVIMPFFVSFREIGLKIKDYYDKKYNLSKLN